MTTEYLLAGRGLSANMSLHIIRQTLINQFIFTNNNDIIKQKGKAQISKAAEILSHLHSHIDLIISSPLSRAYESSKIAADRLAYEKENIVIEPLLIERCFGLGEGMTASERAEKYPGDNYPEMESFKDLIARAHSALEKIVNSSGDKQNILAVAHGAILYAIVTAITEGQIEYGGNMVKFDQGSIYRIKYFDTTIELARYNEEDHDFRNVFPFRGC